MEESGNLVLYDRTPNLYSVDRNLVERGKQKGIIWQTNTAGDGNFAVLDDDGKLLIYDKINQIIWSSN